MEISEKLLDLNAENVMKFVSNIDIFKEFTAKSIKFNVPFSSPFRDDKKPSFVIYNSGRFYDFASGEGGNGITYVMRLHDVCFNDALVLIVDKFGIAYMFKILSRSGNLTAKQAKFEGCSNSEISAEGCVIEITKRKFNSDDKNYWDRYNMTEGDLAKANIIPISHFFLNKKMFIANKLAYGFLERKDGKVTIKIYQPHSSYLKWISNNNASVWELWEQLPSTFNKVIITSSRKDALCITKNTKIPAVALQSETTSPKGKVMEELFNRFDKVYVLFDNDVKSESNWGQIASKKLTDKYHGLINLCIDSENASKDFSDLVCNKGVKEAVSVLNKMLEQ